MGPNDRPITHVTDSLGQEWRVEPSGKFYEGTYLEFQLCAIPAQAVFKKSLYYYYIGTDNWGREIRISRTLWGFWEVIGYSFRTPMPTHPMGTPREWESRNGKDGENADGQQNENLKSVDQPTPRPTSTPTPIPPELLSIQFIYDPSQSKRDRMGPVNCVSNDHAIVERKLTQLEHPVAIADAQGNIFSIVSVETTRTCDGRISSTLNLNPISGHTTVDWSGYIAQWRNQANVVVGESGGPGFKLSLRGEQEPEDLMVKPVQVFLYSTQGAEPPPAYTPGPPTLQQTEIKFEYEPGEGVRPRGHTGSYLRTTELEDENLTIYDAAGNRWQVTHVTSHERCLKSYGRSICTENGTVHTITLKNETRSYPDFREYQAKWRTDGGTEYGFTWKIRDCTRINRQWHDCGEQGLAYFYYVHEGPAEEKYSVEIFDAYRRNP